MITRLQDSESKQRLLKQMNHPYTVTQKVSSNQTLFTQSPVDTVAPFIAIAPFGHGPSPVSMNQSALRFNFRANERNRAAETHTDFKLNSRQQSRSQKRNELGSRIEDARPPAQGLRQLAKTSQPYFSTFQTSKQHLSKPKSNLVPSQLDSRQLCAVKPTSVDKGVLNQGAPITSNLATVQSSQ
jgi:hypothetical protein